MLVDNLRIWHEWEEDDGVKNFEVPVGVSTYKVLAGKNPRNLTTMMKSFK